MIIFFLKIFFCQAYFKFYQCRSVSFVSDFYQKGRQFIKLVQYKNCCMLWLHDIVFYLFTAFICHEHGCPAIVYAPHHQLLISGGRKGEVCIFDIRQRQLRHTFQAHDVPIRCLAMDPEEEYFVTGSSEGDIKVQIPQT